jgi:predicted RNA binding protein YcfA (HicA-like mRNA interferase family)
MKYGELKKLLKKNNCRKEREGASHEIWYSVETGKFFPVGRHDSQDVKAGTLNSILKDAGLKDDKSN